MRDAVNQASQAEKQAGNTSANLGAQAQGVGANLTPFLTSQMEHPQGYSQGDTSAMLAAGLGGAGGANAGLVGQAMQRAAVSRNAGGFQAALGEAARERQKAAAGAAEGIAAKNADLKQQQQENAAQGLQKMYGIDTSGMLESAGQQAKDIEAEAAANQSGWLQNTLAAVNAAANAVRAYKGK